jgi:alkylated DNA repair protein alkB family protein 1
LDLHWRLPPHGLYHDWYKEISKSDHDVRVFRKPEAAEGQAASGTGYYRQQENEENSGGGNRQEAQEEMQLKYEMPSKLIRKLRWITLGRQYNWFTKLYEPTEFPFPKDLGELSKLILRSVGPYLSISVGAIGAGADMEDDKPEEYEKRREDHKGELITHDKCSQRRCSSIPDDFNIKFQGEEKVGYDKEYHPEAGIVNYYQLSDKLTGHVDRSEVNLEAPLVSLSFGHACVFLIGGPNRMEKPMALILHSGDIVIMSGQARRAYHGVPRILENSLPDYLKDYKHGDCELCSQFISTARINMNVRQIFYHEKT